MHEWPAILAHLMRGGAWGYYWRDPGKTSYWWPAHTPRPLPFGGAMGNWYFGVHPCTSCRRGYERGTRETTAAVNCLFAEFDAKDLGGMSGAANQLNSVTPAPTAVVCSGGGYHVYWLLDRPFIIGGDADRDYIDDLQKRWVDYAGGDPGAKDLARVLRVPGTLNRKPKYAPNFPEVRLVRVRWDNVYSLLDLERVMPKPEPARVTRAPARRPRDLWDRIMNPRRRSGDKAAWAEALLDQLNPARADDYAEWVAVGMALSELGDAGLTLWDQWSQQSAKYEPGACEDKWDSFDRDGVSMGTLYHLAQQDGG